MKYMGSKARLSKHLLPIMLKGRKDNQYWVEPFVGGANIIDKVDGLRIGGDNNKYLIAMWKKLQQGWNPPEFISRELYNECRDKYNNNTADVNEFHLIGYVGFNGSYGGRFYDGGYAGITLTKDKKERNYPKEAYKNVMSQIDSICGIHFVSTSYTDIEIPPNSIVYCDIPYSNTKEYKTAKDFNKKEFCDWCRFLSQAGHTVYVSEYEMPDDFISIWEKEVSSSLRANGKISGDKKSTEKLFILRD